MPDKDAQKNSFDKYSTESEDKKNESADELQTKIEDYAKTVGEKTASKFSLDMLPDLPELPDSLQGLLDSIGKKLNDYLNSKINDLKNFSEQLGKSLIEVAKDFAYNLAKKGIDMIASRVYLPELIFLAKVQQLYFMGSNLRYKNDYCRKVVIQRDMPLTLAWINFNIGVKYSIKNSRQAETDLMSLTRKSAIESIDYVLGEFKKELDYLKTVINTYEVDTPIYAQYSNDIVKIRRFICKWIKETIVWSVGNLTAHRLDKLINKYEIKPSMMGTEDEEFACAFLINESDIEIIAPYWETNEYGESFLNKYDLIEKDQDDKYFKLFDEKTRGSTIGSSILANSYEIGSKIFTGNENADATEDLKFKKHTRFIQLRNVWFKYIYVYLTDRGLFNKDVLYNYPLYRRLCYPTMDALSEALDDALANLNIGLGNIGEDRPEIYEYTKQCEEVLKDPTKIVYAQIVSYGMELPAPSIDSDGDFVPPPSTLPPDNNGNGFPGTPANPSNPGGGNNNGNGGGDFWQPGGKPLPGEDFTSDSFDELSYTDKISYIRSVMHYYFLFIRYAKYPELLSSLLDSIEEKIAEHSAEDDHLDIVYEEIVKSYITPLYKTSDFNKETFIENIISSTVEEKFIGTCIEFKLFKTLQTLLPEATEEQYEEFVGMFIKHFTELKHMMYKEVIDSYTSLVLFEKLVFVYNTVKGYFPNIISKPKKEEIKEKFKEYFPGGFDDPMYDVRSYLKTLSEEERKEKAFDIIVYCDNTLGEKKYDKFISRGIYEKIMIEFLPAYELILESKPGKDVDINDPALRDEVRNQLANKTNQWTIILDFDNKIVTDQTLFEYDKLNEDYPYWDKLFRND